MSLKTRKGFSIIETLIYISILAIFSVFVFELVILMSNSYKKVELSRIVANSAVISMERITRDIRGAVSMDQAGSVLGTNPGRLQLFTVDEDGANVTVAFKLESGRINVYENDVLMGPLTSLQASTTELIFRQYTNSGAQAIGIEMTVEATRGPDTRRDSFKTATLIRNSP